MRKPDEAFINQFRERFGYLLLNCDAERGKGGVLVDAKNPGSPVKNAKDIELVDATEVDNSNSGQTVELVSDSLFSRKTHAPKSLSPPLVPKKHKSSHNCGLPGSGAVFHNRGGDLHSPIIQWDSTISPLFDASIQNTPPLSWVGPGCFTPLAQTQHWLCNDTHRAAGICVRVPHTTRFRLHSE